MDMVLWIPRQRLRRCARRMDDGSKLLMSNRLIYLKGWIRRVLSAQKHKAVAA